jgi:quinolinate synthase
MNRTKADELAEGRVVNQVVVDADTARDAKVALERMLSVR